MKTTLKRKLLRLFLLVLSVVALAIVGLIAWLNLRSERERLTEIESQVRQSIASKAHGLVETHALALRGFVVDNAFTDVQRVVESAIEHDPDIVYGLFISTDGTAWAYTSSNTARVPVDSPDREVLVKANLDRWSELGLAADEWKSNQPRQVMRTVLGQELLEVSRPVMDGAEMMGTIRYGISTRSLHRALLEARESSAYALRVMLGSITAVVLLCTLFGFVLVNRAAARIVEPLRELTDATDRIAQGEQGVRVTVETSDELETLGRAFNHMQQANEDAMTRLNSAMQAALEASRLKSEFLANMSHEIRTPMNGILGMVRLMLRLPLDGKLRRYAETADTSASALMTIINDVLDFSKMEAGKYTLQTMPFDPGLVLQEVAELLAGKAYDKGLELSYRRAREVPPLVLGDPDRYRQILTNLVGNAIKFTSHGDIFIEQSIDAESDGSWVVRTVVHDTGIGISAEDQGKLFSAFSQVDGSMVRQYGGTGLGLAISRRLTELMEGQIGVHSERGIGSKFWFTAKFGKTPLAAKPAPAPLPDGRKALVVEASRRWCRLIEEHLITWGLACDVTQDAASALDKLHNGGEYHIAVVGAQLGDIGIAAFMQALRKERSAAQLPVILLTQLGASAPLSEVENEVAAQLAKPLRVSELYDCIVNAFSGAGPHVAARRGRARVAKRSNKRILVVDDNEINQFVATEQIAALGYEVDVASNGEEAVLRVKATQYALVFMDCQMPVLDGYGAARAIREWEGNQRHIPIIALTAHAMAGERDKVLAAGMDDYLSKPLRAQSLERMLERYLLAEEPANDTEPVEVERSETLALDPNTPRTERLTELFVSRVPDDLCELDEAVSAAAAPRVRDKAHKIKGSCLALGAGAMAEEAELLQSEAERGELSQAAQRAKALWEHFDRVCLLLENEKGNAA